MRAGVEPFAHTNPVPNPGHSPGLVRGGAPPPRTPPPVPCARLVPSPVPCTRHSPYKYNFSLGPTGATRDRSWYPPEKIVRSVNPRPRNGTFLPEFFQKKRNVKSGRQTPAQGRPFPRASSTATRASASRRSIRTGESPHGKYGTRCSEHLRLLVCDERCRTVVS